MEDMLDYIAELTGLTPTVETKAMATWQMTVLDNTRRKEMAGPCKVSWKDGIKRALEISYPALLN